MKCVQHCMDRGMLNPATVSVVCPADLQVTYVSILSNMLSLSEQCFKFHSAQSSNAISSVSSRFAGNVVMKVEYNNSEMCSTLYG